MRCGVSWVAVDRVPVEKAATKGKGDKADKAGQQREERDTHTHTANNDDQQKAKWGAPVQTTGTSRLVGNQPGCTQDPQTLVSSSTYNGDCSVRRSERASERAAMAGRQEVRPACVGEIMDARGQRETLSLSLVNLRPLDHGRIMTTRKRHGIRTILSLSLSLPKQPRLHPVRRSRESPPRGIVIVNSVISVDARTMHFYVRPRSSLADQPGRKQRKNRSSSHHGSRKSRPLCTTSARDDTFDQGMTGIPHPFGTCTPFTRRYRSDGLEALSTGRAWL